ncbi:MAG: hypothetical protein CFK48_05980 [Armatimonadetes bacterium CP1_7O]|nr:MAG: hypothetical protein CFK48_05980 [Armatimonadetes bacterium CP1_7O]
MKAPIPAVFRVYYARSSMGISLTVEVSCGEGVFPIPATLTYWGELLTPDDPFSMLGTAWGRMIPDSCREQFWQIVDNFRRTAPLMLERVLLQQNATHENAQIQQYWQALLDSMPDLPQKAQQIIQAPPDYTSLTWQWALAVAGSPGQIADYLDQVPLRDWHHASVLWLLRRAVEGDNRVWKFLWDRMHEICSSLQEEASIIAVVMGLGNSASDRAWYALEPLIAHSSPAVRAAVYNAIAALGEVRARPHLRSALTTEQDPAPIDGVIAALGRVGEAQDAASLIDYAFNHPRTRSKVKAALVQIGQDALPAIRDYLRDGIDVSLKHHLIDTLQQIGAPDVITVLREGYHRLEEFKLRRHIIRVVVELGHREGIPLLLEALGDPSEGVRTIACDGLVAHGEAAVDSLLEHFEDPPWGIERRYLAQWAAGRALARIGGNTVKQRLMELAQSYDMNLRWASLTALRHADYPDLGEWMAQQLANAPWTIQHECALYLCKYPTPQAIPELMEALRNPQPIVQEILQAAIAANGVAAIPVLQQHFDQWQAFGQRMATIHILQQIGHPAGLYLLEKLASDLDHRIAERAQEAIKQLTPGGTP